MIISEQRIQQYLNHCRYKKELKENSLSAYEIDLICFLRFLNYLEYGRDISKLEEVSIPEIEIFKGKFFQYCKDEKQFSEKTVCRIISAVNGYMLYCNNRFNEPFMQFKGETTKILPKPAYLKKADRTALIEGLSKDKFYFRNKALILMFLRTGAKVSEVSKLNYEDGIEKGTKLANRFVSFDVVLESAIRDYLNNERGREKGPLFLSYKDTRLTPRSIQRIVKKADECSGMFKEITPDKLRQTYMVDLYLKGTDEAHIKEILNMKENLNLGNPTYL